MTAFRTSVGSSEEFRAAPTSCSARSCCRSFSCSSSCFSRVCRARLIGRRMWRLSVGVPVGGGTWPSAWRSGRPAAASISLTNTRRRVRLSRGLRGGGCSKSGSKILFGHLDRPGKTAGLSFSIGKKGARSRPLSPAARDIRIQSQPNLPACAGWNPIRADRPFCPAYSSGSTPARIA